MSLNCKEINAVLDELSLEGSFIQGVAQSSFDSLALFLYKSVHGDEGGVAHNDSRSKTLLIHLAPGACRIHETARKIPKTPKPLRFMEFLKSRVKGTKIIECAQIGNERVIKIVCARGDETLLIFARLWSGAGNVIVTDARGAILDTLYRKPKRGEVTGGVFVPPEAGDGGGSREYRVRDFAELRAHLEPAGGSFESLSLNQKIDLWYGEYADKFSREALIAIERKRHEAKTSRMQNALGRLEAKRGEFLHADRLRHQGDLILSFAHLIDDTDDSGFLECEDYDTGQKICIKIDPKKSAQQNAHTYYANYKKAVSGIEELEYDIARAKKELLDEEARHEAVLREENPIRLRQLIEQHHQPRQQSVKKRPGVTYEIDGWTIFAGRTAAENDELLRRHVKGADMWLHTRDVAGGYIFIKAQRGKTVPLDILLYAGNLALFYSKARASDSADLYYTQVKHLRRAKDAPKGTVLPSHEKNILIKRDPARLKTLEEGLGRV